MIYLEQMKRRRRENLECQKIQLTKLLQNQLRPSKTSSTPFQQIFNPTPPTPSLTRFPNILKNCISSAPPPLISTTRVPSKDHPDKIHNPTLQTSSNASTSPPQSLVQQPPASVRVPARGSWQAIPLSSAMPSISSIVCVRTSREVSRNMWWRWSRWNPHRLVARLERIGLSANSSFGQSGSLVLGLGKTLWT